MKRLLLIALALLAAISCNRQDNSSFSEDQFRRSLEQAIKIAEKIQEEEVYVRHIAETEGSDVATKVYDSLQCRKKLDDFWTQLEKVEKLSHLLDSTRNEEYLERYLPYLKRLQEVAPYNCIIELDE